VSTTLLFALFVGIVIAIAAGSYYLKQKRKENCAAFAAKYGFSYSPAGPPGLLAYSFPLLHKGDGRGAENGITGAWKDMSFKAADYWYYTESRDSKGNRTKNYSHFSVAVTEIDAWLPDLAVYRENVFTALADKLGLKDINFESEEFNRAFQIRSDNRKFAFELVDPRMMQWLLSCDDSFGFELHGKAILIYSHRLRPHELLPLIGSLKEFRDRIPRLVWTNYGYQRPAEA